MGLGQLLGNATDKIGTALNLPEWNFSEKIAGGNTAYTGSSPQARAYEQRLQQNLSTDYTGGRTPTVYKPQGEILGLGDVSGGSGSGFSGGLSNLANNDPFAGSNDALRAGTDAELGSLNTQFDRLRSDLEGQLPYLQNERSRSLSNLSNEMTGLRNQVTGQKEASQQNTESQIDDAGQIARQTQRSNRNTLRALGILNSSAAGEMLSKPLNEFDKVRATVMQEGTRRLNELDNFLNQKTSEHSNLVAQIEDNYGRMIGQIQNDLRFNERERADAIRGANAALQQRMAEIQQAQSQWKMQVETMKMQLASQLGQLSNYQMPTAETGGISGLQGMLEQKAAPSQTAAIYTDDKKRLSGLVN